MDTADTLIALKGTEDAIRDRQAFTAARATVLACVQECDYVGTGHSFGDHARNRVESATMRSALGTLMREGLVGIDERYRLIPLAVPVQQ